MADKPVKLSKQAVERIAMTRSRLARGCSADECVEWLISTMVEDTTRGHEAKTWKVSPAKAHEYVEIARLHMRKEDERGKDDKRAGNRATAVAIIQKLVANGSVSALAHALRGVDLLCRIDGSFDPSVAAAANMLQPATEEEALVMIKHTHDTYQLAQRRGLALPPSSGPVIDVDSHEHEDDDVEETLVVEPSGSAN